MFAVPNTTLVLLVKKALPACDNCGDRPEFFIKGESAEFKSNATCATPESRYRKPLDYPPLSDNVNKSLVSCFLFASILIITIVTEFTKKTKMEYSNNFIEIQYVSSFQRLFHKAKCELLIN